MQNHSIEVQLLGQRVALKSQENPEFVQEVVDLVTLKLQQAERRVKGSAAHQVALLALMDLAEEFLKAKRLVVDHQNKINEKSEELLGLIEAEFK